MYDKINESIDFHLNKIYNSEGKFGWIFTLNTDSEKPISNPLRFVQHMQSKGIVDIEPTKGQRVDITEYGNQISEQGGWLEYLKATKLLEEKEQLKNQLREQVEEINIKKLTNEYILSKWKKGTFWWIFGIAIFSGLYSLYDIISNLTKTEIPKENIITKQQLESELSKLRTLILDQKTLDSLGTRNNEPKLKQFVKSKDIYGK